MRVFPKVLLVAFTLLVLIVLTLAYNNALGSGNKESLVGGSVKMSLELENSEACQ